MAGEIYIFNAAKEWEGDGTLDMDGHTFKAALITSAYTPAASTATPTWGAAGTNLSAYEVTPGGNYSAGGVALTNVTWVESAGVVTFDSDNVTWAQNASNPTNARWMIVYSDTAANKNCLLFVDLGGATDLSAGAFTFNVPASGWFTKA